MAADNRRDVPAKWLAFGGAGGYKCHDKDKRTVKVKGKKAKGKAERVGSSFSGQMA
jgi:hypothetical protein